MQKASKLQKEISIKLDNLRFSERKIDVVYSLLIYTGMEKCLSNCEGFESRQPVRENKFFDVSSQGTSSELSHFVILALC